MIAKQTEANYVNKVCDMTDDLVSFLLKAKEYEELYQINDDGTFKITIEGKIQ